MMKQTANRRRRGAALIFVLVIVAVLTALMAIAAQNVVSARRVLNNRSNQLQSLWLARAGLEVAVDRLRSDQNYQGETLDLIADSRLEIKVEKEGDGKLRVTSEAQFTGIGTIASKTVLIKAITK
jgi:type II secretory pathway component PulK